MSKLFSLKEWLTLEDSAIYLTKILSEPVTQADILSLAIAGKLIISVYIVNPVSVITGKVVPKSKFIGSSTDVLKNGDVLVFGEEITRISGIFDLPMIGGEVRDCEQKLQELIGGPIVMAGHPRGAYMRDFQSENYYQMLSYFSEKGEILPSWPGLDDSGKWHLRSRLFQKSFIAKHIEQGGDLKELKTQPTNDDLFVVRTSALRDFVDSIALQIANKPLITTERNTLLTIISVLMKKAGLDKLTCGKASGFIEGESDTFGTPVAKRTIEGHLRKTDIVWKGP